RRNERGLGSTSWHSNDREHLVLNQAGIFHCISQCNESSLRSGIREDDPFTPVGNDVCPSSSPLSRFICIRALHGGDCNYRRHTTAENEIHQRCQRRRTEEPCCVRRLLDGIRLPDYSSRS